MSAIFSDLDALLNQLKPSRLLLICEQPCPLKNTPEKTAVFSARNFIEEKALSERYDLAILIHALTTLDKPQGNQLIGKITNVYANHCLIAHTQTSGWKDTDFFSFGMSQLNHYESHADSPNEQLFEYNIANYKNVPTWLNNQFWANPSMWNKHRW